eukprot:5271681-Amphidinium_carterae.1
MRSNLQDWQTACGWRFARGDVLLQADEPPLPLCGKCYGRRAAVDRGNEKSESGVSGTGTSGE